MRKIQYQHGSVWRKWDLHIHTPASFHWNGQKFSKMNDAEKQQSLKRIFEAIEASDVSVFGIMDYWTFDGYIMLKEYIESNNLTLTKTVLPGMEIRVEAPTDYRMNLHFIFSDNLTYQQLYDFKNTLKIRIGNNTRSLSEEALTQLGASFDDSKAQINGFTGLRSDDDNFKLGSICAEVTRESIDEALSAIPRDQVIVLLPWDTYGGAAKLDWKEHPSSSHHFMQLAEMFEIRNQRSYDLFVGHKTHENEKFIDTFQQAIGGPKPVLSGSDAHRVEDYGRYPGNKVTWIKADPTYLGLRQTLYEPSGRVRIQSEMPEEKISYNVIDAVRFIDNTGENLFPSEWIYLNPNLNVIIGGKSSGKSLLLHHIAKTVDPDQVDEVEGHRYPFEKMQGFDFEVRWKDGEVNSLSNLKYHRQITYIPQMHINSLVEDGNNRKLEGIILDVLLQNKDFKEQYDSVKRSIREENKSIDITCNELFAAKEELEKTQDDLRKLGDQTGISNEIERIRLEIDQLQKESNLTNEDVELYQTLNTQNTAVSKQIRDYKRAISILSECSSKIEAIRGDVIEKINNLFQEIKVQLHNEEFNSELEKIVSSLTKGLIASFTEGFEYIKFIQDSWNMQEQDLEKEVVENQEKLKPIIAKFKNQERINELQLQLNRQENILSTILQQKEEVRKRIDYCKQLEEKIINNYKKVYELYQSVVDMLNKEEYKQISSDIQLNVSLKFDLQKFASNFVAKLDRRKRLNSLFEVGFDDSDLFVFDKHSHVDTIKKLLHSVLHDEEIRVKKSVEKMDITKYLVNDYFYIDYDLTYKGDSITQMSPGKRGLVLLKLYLHISNAKHPILIDQPEDNLDNRTISTELLEFIKEKKIERQIIVVTHNANLVVLADAEEVIVANQSGQQAERDNETFRFDYVSGSLECSFSNPEAKGILKQLGIKEHVCDILEGGKDAFIKREQKYGLRKIIY